jgi:DNA-binding MarR family transcriptional regulator
MSRTEYEALGEFRYQIRRFLHFSEEAARAAGVEPQQHQLLLAAKALERAGTPTIKTLAGRLQIQHHSMVELVDRSVRRGLVRRTRRPPDRRHALVELKPKGERILRELSLHHRDALRVTGPALCEALGTLLKAGSGTLLNAKPGAGKASVPRRRLPAETKRRTAAD